MAQSKGNIQRTDMVEVETDGPAGKVAVPAGVVQSVTTEVPSEADATSAPNKLPDDVNRPPVSTNRPDVPIAHSLVAGAGAPTGEPDYHPEWGPDQNPDLGAQAAADEAAKASSSKSEDKK